MTVDVKAWADALRTKDNSYITAREFTANLPVMSLHAEGQLTDKLSTGGFQINRSAWNALSLDTKIKVARELGCRIDRTWLIRSIDSTVVAILGSDYTIVDHSVVADAVAECGVPCIEVFPNSPDLDEKIVYFRLVDEDMGYDLGDGKAGVLSVNVRNSEVGVSSIGADVGICRFENGKPYYMWSKDRLSVDSCIRHYSKDPDEVVKVIREILSEAPEIAQLHADMVMKMSKMVWMGWSETDLERYPKYVIENVESTNPKSVADVYMAICYALREVENAESRRRLERQAGAILTGESGLPSKGKTKTVGAGLCPLCGK